MHPVDFTAFYLQAGIQNNVDHTIDVVGQELGHFLVGLVLRNVPNEQASIIKTLVDAQSHVGDYFKVIELSDGFPGILGAEIRCKSITWKMGAYYGKAACNLEVQLLKVVLLKNALNFSENPLYKSEVLWYDFVCAFWRTTFLYLLSF